MSVYFLDSSAVVKRYVVEIGSGWIRALADPGAGHQLVIARITWVEVLSAFARRQREASLSTDDMDRATRAFHYDLDTQYRVIELDKALAEAAGELVAKHPVRAYDAVQLASALRVRSRVSDSVFLTADDQLMATAMVEGLFVDNPNQHP